MLYVGGNQMALNRKRITFRKEKLIEKSTFRENVLDNNVWHNLPIRPHTHIK